MVKNINKMIAVIPISIESILENESSYSE